MRFGSLLAPFSYCMTLDRRKPLLLTAILAMTPVPFWAGQPAASKDCKARTLPSDAEIADRVTNAELQRLAGVQEYSAVRKYRLHNSHWQQDAQMTVKLSYNRDRGKSFDVIKLENASGMSRKVLERLVQTEAETSRNQSRNDFNVTKSNYKFHVTGMVTRDGRQCYVVELTPKRKIKYLIQGKAWVDISEYALVRVEGRPAANLSFWVGKPYIVQDFQKVGQYWMAAHNRSQSESFILGSSVLTIEYRDYQIQPDVRLADAIGTTPKPAVVE